MIGGVLERWWAHRICRSVISSNHKFTFRRFDELIRMHAHKTKPKKKIEDKSYIRV